MLVLTRQTNEKILIGDDVEITVLATSGNQVRLAVKAPKTTPVHREEVYQQIQRSPKR